MKSSFLKSILRTTALASVSAFFAAGTASAADVYLQTQSATKSLPGGASAPTWRFACGATAPVDASCESTSAGVPRIGVAAGASLTIHLTNTLNVPVSITIPGQAGGGDPVPFTDSRGRQRMRSFTTETLPGSVLTPSAEVTYTWNALRPGTYLFHSGSQPSLQVPMGLFGAIVVSPVVLPGDTTCAAGESRAYGSAASCYNTEQILLFSEIDPVLNSRVEAAVGTGTPGTACVSRVDYEKNGTVGYPCTVDYRPTFFLINGEAYSKTTPPAALASMTPGTNVMLRFLNAGQRTHAPAVVGLGMELIAEDGSLYPGLARKQSEILLAAGKTLDARVALPGGDATYALFDRMAYSSKDDTPVGGMVAKLQAGAGSTPPPAPTTYATNDAYTVPEDANPYSGSSVLTNDVGLAGATLAVVAAPANGTLVLNADGTFEYRPYKDYYGPDGFTYSATLGGVSYPAQVSINVTPENDAPVAAADGPYVNAVGTSIKVDTAHGVLGNDSDPDGDLLTAVIEGVAPAGLTLNADGSFTYTGGVATTFQYRATDGTLVSDAVTVELNFNPLANITLNVQEPGGVPVTQYRWLVEEDAMWQPDPNNPQPDTLGTNFHRSYMPVVASGCVGTDTVQNGDASIVIPVCSESVPFEQLALDPNKHYYVSVLPLDAMTVDGNGTRIGHTLGGARIPPSLRGTSGALAPLTVNVNKLPLPYAQISIFVFEDNSPTNGAVDGAETAAGLGSFQITLEDAGGKYGASAGIQSQDADGNPLKNALNCFGGNPPPEGVILTCPDTQANRDAGLVGQAIIAKLAQGKYGVSATPPLGSTKQWVQTSTIEGTRVIDAWVKPGEPPFFAEFGPVGQHVFIGFVSPENVATAKPAGGTNSVTGKITNMHMSRPPVQTLWDSTTNDAFAHTVPWVGLNSASGIGPNYAAVQADDAGNFTIGNVPDGDYQLVVWDKYLDLVIGYRSVTVSGGTEVNVGTVPMFQWFARTEHNVYLDLNQNGVRDEGEPGLPEQNINLRFRDGTLYQTFPTDLDGFVPFDQVFPFFHWLVAEVDFLRYKPTGLTVMVDGGGDVTSTGFILNPQLQVPGDLGSTTRTEVGPVLTQGFQQFLGQTSIFDWGKAPYAAGENGGIAGIVYYAVTRAEGNPRLGVGEPWEPGIPRVKVRLYRELPGGGLALVKETQTDSWDDTLPTGCPGENPSDPLVTSGNVTPADKCYDGLRNFNQARPAVFDGGYAFADIPPGKYVVEVVPPPGYTLVKEEDVNVVFGDGYAAEFLVAGTAVVNTVPDPATIIEAQLEPGIAQPPCVGTVREVPPILSLFPSAAEAAPFAGALKPLCDRKAVTLKDQGQAAADFYLYTGAPIAGHIAGMVLDDLAQEFDARSPQFGEKWAPPFVPISVRDHLGREISRIVTDQWGRMNGLVPSTYTAYMPSPSGYAAATHMTCINDPGPIPNPAGGTMIDPNYNPAYSNFCYTFQYMPGSTTYLDTPVLPVSAFASGYNPVSCSPNQATPVIRQVDGTGFGPLVAPGGTLTITSMGSVEVPNPAYEGPMATSANPLAKAKTITRDYGFGAQGANSRVRIGTTTLTIVSWDNNTIRALAPSTDMTGQLEVRRANGNLTERAVTVTVSNETPLRAGAGQALTIQQAINDATPGQLILVAPGAYDEQLIMWKPVRVQGAGAGSTLVNGVKRPTDKLLQWRADMDCFYGIGAGCTQRVNSYTGVDGAANYDTEEGAPFTVVGPSAPGAGSFASSASRIDGFAITGGDTGGGIFVDAYAHNLVISNNHVFGNQGAFHGGIRVGRPQLELLDNGPYGFNSGVRIQYNTVAQNGGLGGAGGGLSLNTGSDGYNVNNNFVCGNFTTGDGGGIGHLGHSQGGTIANNRIVFNQAFNQGVTVSGGGVFVGGEPGPGGALTRGSGNVTITGNLIQGNHAGAGFGGGVRAQFVNGQDVLDSILTNGPNAGRAVVGQWHQLVFTLNTVIDNVTGWEGGGVSLQDVARSTFNTNTIAYNDSTATVGALVVGNTSANQVAGVATANHTQALADAIPLQDPPGTANDTAGLRVFSNPSMNTQNHIVLNRSFHYDATSGTGALMPVLSQAAVGQCPAGADYWDLDPLLGGSLSTTTGTTNRLTSPYCNGGRTLVTVPGPMQALPALDEGGNAWIDVRFGPLTLEWQAY